MGSGNPSATHWSMPFASLSDVRISGFAVGREIAICQSAKQPQVAFSILSYPIPRPFQGQLKNLTCCSPKPGLGDTQRWHEGSEGTLSRPEWTCLSSWRHRDPEELSIAEAAKTNLTGFFFRSTISILNLDSLSTGVQATLPAQRLQVTFWALDQTKLGVFVEKTEAILSF